LIAALPKQADDASNTLASSWADLVEQLALGPEPELRECPNCKKFGMRAASLCSHCWTKLTPHGKE